MLPTKKQQRKDLKKLSKKQLIEQVLISREIAWGYIKRLNVELRTSEILEQSLKSAENALTLKEKDIEYKDRLLSAITQVKYDLSSL